jgi:hypothetical protein
MEENAKAGAHVPAEPELAPKAMHGAGLHHDLGAFAGQDRCCTKYLRLGAKILAREGCVSE